MSAFSTFLWSSTGIQIKFTTVINEFSKKAHIFTYRICNLWKYCDLEKAVITGLGSKLQINLFAPQFRIFIQKNQNASHEMSVGLIHIWSKVI